jgi:hypothetical protein
VSVAPGAIVFTLMPNSDTSETRFFANIYIAAFVMP